MLYYAVLHVSKTVCLLNIPSIISGHFQAKQKKKKSEQDLNMFLDILYILLLRNVLQHLILE